MIEFPLIVERFEAPETPPDADDWHYSELGKPCACGNRKLDIIEVEAPSKGCEQRVAVRCPDCGALGEDTCHGKTHAMRRWNWHGDQRVELKQADVVPFERGGAQ